jgi:signal transduction histidine kinase
MNASPTKEESQADRNDLKSHGSAAELPPQITLLLDEDGRLLSANRKRAGTSLHAIADTEGLDVHGVLHVACPGDCPLDALWLNAWSQFKTSDIREWEINDPLLNKVLRLNLVRSPNMRQGKAERRSARSILTIKDITAFREAHESLIDQKNELLNRVHEQDINLSESCQQLANECQVHDRNRELLAESRRKLRFLAYQLTCAQEHERRRIALDLHDGIAQRLSATKYYIEGISEKLKREDSDLEIGMLDEAIDQIKSTAEELRRVSSNLSPSQLDDYGIQVAVEILCKEFEMQYPDSAICHKINLGKHGLPELIEIAIYRVVQEALHNISKHAEAMSVQICLTESDAAIALTIVDDGCGFCPPDQQLQVVERPGSGLRNMRKRVEATAGVFEIVSQSGDGTRISATWSDKVLRLLGSSEAVRDGVSRYGRDAV